MKLLVLLVSLVVSIKVLAGDDLTKVARCSWGYNHTASIIDRDSREKLYPEGLSSWELCKLAFETDLNHEASDWVVEALSFLEVAPNQLKPIEMITKGTVR